MTNLDDLLGGARSVGIAGHVRPDGDCAGSCLATYNYIKTYHPDISADLYLEPIPNIFKFMARSGEIKSDFSGDARHDLFIALDCGDLERLGGAARYFKGAGRTACIDHHVSNESFADENLVVPDASSTSELVFGLIPRERLTREIAECIYTGIIHDTGVFQYSCTSKKTMEAAGVLMETGIDYPGIVDRTFYEKTFNQNKILGLALLKSRLFLDGRCIASVITAEEMESYDVLPKHLEGIVSHLRSTKGVEAAIFLYEAEDGAFKASMRSADFVDVARIAVRHGGGGHVRAAGFTARGGSEEILCELVAEVGEQLNGADAGMAERQDRAAMA